MFFGGLRHLKAIFYSELLFCVAMSLAGAGEATFSWSRRHKTFFFFVFADEETNKIDAACLKTQAHSWIVKLIACAYKTVSCALFLP